MSADLRLDVRISVGALIHRTVLSDELRGDLFFAVSLDGSGSLTDLFALFTQG